MEGENTVVERDIGREVKEMKIRREGDEGKKKGE